MKIRKLYILLTMLPFFLSCSISYADSNPSLDQALLSAMRNYHVPVVGYAIIDHGRIVRAKTVSIDPKIHVTQSSLFQAASISKSVSAYGALRLVYEGRLKLDEAANKQLRGWKIPKSKYSENDPVTLRQILSMTSGLSVSGFPGYRQGLALPTLQQILDGKSPANNLPIRVFYRPGSRYFYSGGGYQVLQQLMQDASNKSFSQLMSQLILKPLDMQNSVFQYPISSKLRSRVVPGFWANGTMLYGGWNNYAIAASGGLWSTPSDLAKFAINVSDAYSGKSNGLISKQLAQQMLARQKNSDFGLGVVVNGYAKTLNFRKNGHNFGYHAQLLMFPNTGQGAVIMTDSENGMSVINFIMPIIAHEYHWPSYFPYFDELVKIPTYT